MNIICPDYKNNVVQKASVRRCEKTKKPIGRFNCPTCGFSYTRKGKDQDREDRYKYTCIMGFGFLWKKELQSLLEKKLSYREITRILNVDPGTVIKYKRLMENGLMELGNTRNRKENDIANKRRYEWLQLQQGYPNLSKTELRKQSPALYAFLYRHDRDWLNGNSPIRNTGNAINNRVNWLERDQEVLKKVQKVAKNLKNKGNKPKRITVKTLGDGIGERSLLEKHLDKMPVTKEFIEHVWESEKDFRLRRVQNVIKQMNESGETIKLWKVLRKANIKAEFYDEVNDIIQSQLNDTFS